MKRGLCTLLVLVLAAAAAGFAAAEEPAAAPLPVKVLIIPKFEVGELYGDFPGEAQYYYEHYLMGSEEYDIPCALSKLYYKDGVALFLTGMGKINAVLGTMAVLSDSRFDFSGAYILSTGCAGSSAEDTVMGDVFVITAVVDFDLGHHADAREIADPEGTTWFHDAVFDASAVVRLDPGLMDRVYALVKDTPVATTEVTRNYMRAAFGGADRAARDPRVTRGTAVTADNYWKGPHDHQNALLATAVYQCPDPYAVTEMEEIGIARTAERMGMLDRLIILRDSVNIDVFLLGATPESLWTSDGAARIAAESSVETADIFATAMKNNFDVGRILIDAILAGRF